MNYRPQKRPAKHFPRCHYNQKHGRRWQAKHPFETEHEAAEYVHKNGLEYKYNIYRCDYCGKFHIGRARKKRRPKRSLIIL